MILVETVGKAHTKFGVRNVLFSRTKTSCLGKVVSYKYLTGGAEFVSELPKSLS